MREKPPIAVLVNRLRRRARLSQRGLAELAGVSAAAIARIEYGFDRKSGGPVKPEPDTLRAIARGLATSADGDVDVSAEQRIYRELLDAAGYDLLIGDPAPGVTRDGGAERARRANRETALAEIESLVHKFPEAAIALTDLARGADEWDDDDVEFVLSRLRRLAERYGRSRVAC